MADRKDDEEQDYRPVSISALRSRFENLSPASAPAPTSTSFSNRPAATKPAPSRPTTLKPLPLKESAAAAGEDSARVASASGSRASTPLPQSSAAQATATLAIPASASPASSTTPSTSKSPYQHKSNGSTSSLSSTTPSLGQAILGGPAVNGVGVVESVAGESKPKGRAPTPPALRGRRRHGSGSSGGDASASLASEERRTDGEGEGEISHGVAALRARFGGNSNASASREASPAAIGPVVGSAVAGSEIQRTLSPRPPVPPKQKSATSILSSTSTTSNPSISDPAIPAPPAMAVSSLHPSSASSSTPTPNAPAPTLSPPSLSSEPTPAPAPKRRAAPAVPLRGSRSSTPSLSAKPSPVPSPEGGSTPVMEQGEFGDPAAMPPAQTATPPLPSAVPTAVQAQLGSQPSLPPRLPQRTRTIPPPSTSTSTSSTSTSSSSLSGIPTLPQRGSMSVASPMSVSPPEMSALSTSPGPPPPMPPRTLPPPARTSTSGLPPMVGRLNASRSTPNPNTAPRNSLGAEPGLPSVVVNEASPGPGGRSRSATNPPSRLPPRPVPARPDAPGTSPAPGFGSTEGVYQPPPPPTRQVTPQASPQPNRVRRATSIGQNGDDGDENSDEGEEDGEGGTGAAGGAAGLGRSGTVSGAKRAMEEHPDTTRAYRKAPDFVPKQILGSTQAIQAYAVCGYKAVLGGSNVRIFDMTLDPSRPLFTIEPKATGLIFLDKKDIKVTSVAFRSAGNVREEGRYVWCGTSAGHIFEVDIATGQVTDLMSSVHSGSVAWIFRHKEWMVTMDEAGKAHVFGSFGELDLLDSEPGKSVAAPTRTIRTAGRENHVRMLGGLLWTSTAPLSRSTTNTAGSQGPTIRVYDILGLTSAPGTSRTTFTSEWTGAVTSMTIMPLRPETVYMGHEGGYVSVFDRESLECKTVWKISPTDILALEGVGDKLWAGFRSGVIQAYDIDTSPWTAKNSWTAHTGYSLTSITVDPYSISQSGRFAVWSCSRDFLHGWDGLLSVDWCEARLVEREAEYCTFSDKTVLVCSWNIDSSKPSDLAGGIPENMSFMTDVLSSVDSPDILTFGFQEVIDLNDKKLTAKNVLFGGKSKGDGKGLKDNVSGAYRLWQDKLVASVRAHMPVDCPYTLLYSESMVGLLTVVFVKSSMKDGLQDVAMITVKRGLNGIYGNKGAIVARLTVNDTSVCFINVHLAAGQRQKQARNSDLTAILEDKAVLPSGDNPLTYISGGDGSAVTDHEMVILSGDLNYRIDQRRDTVIGCVQQGDLAFLWEHDQLHKELQSNSSFRLRSFAEAPITFAPTYKYEPNSNDYDMSPKMRIPAWCDRVLYRARDPSRIECLHYRRYEPNISDHRPISAGLKLRTKMIDPDRYDEVRSEVQEDWFKHESDFLDTMLDAMARI